MTTRRPRGRGSVYREGAGYVAAISLGGGGRRKRRARSQGEAWDALDELLREAGLGIDGGDALLRDYLLAWLEHAERGWAPSTAYRQRGIVRNHLIPELGHLRLDQLGPQHVQRLLDRKSRRLSPRSVQYVRVVLHTAIDQARRWRMVPENVVGLVPGPSVRRDPVVPLTAAEAATLLEDAPGTDAGTLYALAILTGMRQGELLALRWRDVDLEAGALRVERTLYRPSRAAWELRRPKTEGSRRRIAIGPQLVALLREHRQRQRVARLAAGSWVDLDLVFPAGNGEPRYASSVTKRFQQDVRRLGIRQGVRFHDLRHTAASLMLARGLSLKVIQEQLGHANFAFTADVYTHLEESLRRDVADTMDGLLGGGAG